MKHLVITLFLVTQTVFTFGQIVNDDLNFFNYSYDKATIKKNKVETVTIEATFSEGKCSGKTIYYFDKEGLLTKQTITDPTGIIKREFYFFTNSHHDLVSIIQNDYENKKVDTVFYFKYYDGDQLIKDSSSEIPISYSYEYAQHGKLLKTIVNTNLGLGNNIKRVIINQLDSLSRIVKCVETVYQNHDDLIGSKISDRDFIYNDEGKIEKEIENISSETLWMYNKGTINYEYDSSGNLTKMLRSNAASYSYVYNEKGLIATKKMLMYLKSEASNDKEKKFETIDKFTYTFRQ